MKWTLNLSEFLVKHRLILLFATIMLAALAGTHIHKIEVGNVNDDMGYEDHPYIIQSKLVQDLFDDIPSSFLYIIANDSEDILSNESIKLIRRITEESAELPYVTQVRSISNQKLITATEDDLLLEPILKNQETFSAQELSEITQTILDDNEYSNSLLSVDKMISPISISFRFPEGISHAETLKVRAELIQKVDERLKSYQEELPSAKIFAHGFAFVGAAVNDELMRVLLHLTPLIMLISCAAFWFLIRSVRALILGLMSLFVVSQVFSLGMIGAAGITLSEISAMGPAIITMVVGADSVHVMSMFYQNLRKGQAQNTAMVNALSFNLLPILLTSVTTSLGFLSLNFSDMPMMQDLGNITAFGTMVAFLITLTVMPALLLLVDNTTPIEPLSLEILMNKTARFVIKKQKIIFYGMNVFIAVCVFGLVSLEMNYFHGTEFRKGHPIRDNIDFLDKRILHGPPAIYVFDSGKEEGIYEPEFLTQINKFSEWTRQQDKVLNTNSFLDLVQKIHKNMNGGDESIPQSSDQIAQYMFLLELLGFDDYQTIGVSADKSKLSLSISVEKSSNLDLFEIEDRSNQWLENNLPDLKVYAQAGAYNFPHIFTTILSDLIKGSVYALLVITIILIFAFRSLKFGIISTIPNLFPAMMVFGLWSYLVGYITFIDACIFSITIGIVVDDTVHFVSKYMTHRKLGFDYEESIIKTFESVGTALIITTVTFTLGLAIILFTYLNDMTMIVKLTMPILYMALLLDFFYLPAILLRVENFSKAKNSLTS